MEFFIQSFDELPSTNLLLKELAAQGAPEGTVITARTQSAGRGRLGRSFFSPDGGLYLSLLLRPASLDFSVTLITTAAAVAMAEAVEEVLPELAPVDIKWVNDLYRRGRKICGILAEGQSDGTAHAVVLGVGLNLCEPAGGFPEEIRGKAAACLSEALSDEDLIVLRHKLTKAFLGRFDAFYGQFPGTSYLDGYRKRLFLLGKEVSYCENGLMHRAAVAGVADDGGLLLIENGQEKKLTAGEVSLSFPVPST